MYLEKQKAVDNLTVLRDVFCEVLEELAFLFAESASGDWTHTFNTLEYFHASIRFKGLENHIGGEIGIVCPDNLGWTLASNILGIEGEAIENSVCGKDALREFLNIICGRFLTAQYGNGPVFNLSIPGVSTKCPAEWREYANKPESLGFIIDDEIPVIVYLSA